MNRTSEIDWFDSKDAQSKIKHHLLSSYLRDWAIIVRQKHVYFCDCFAGAGAYEDDEPGSPLIAAQILGEIQVRNPSCNFHVRNIEHNSELYARLQERTFAAARLVDIRNHHGEFSRFLPTVLREITSHGDPHALFFIDPFGYLDADPEPIKTIMAAPRREVLVNLMSYALVRASGIDEEKWRVGVRRTLGRSNIDFDSGTVEKEVVDAYCKQFRDLGYYVCAGRVRSFENPNIYFHMVHISSHWRALMEMKRQMRKNVGYQEDLEKTATRQMMIPFVEEFFNEMTLSEYEDRLFETYRPIGSVPFVDLIDRELQFSPFDYGQIKKCLKSLKKRRMVISDGNCEDNTERENKEMATLRFVDPPPISEQTTLFDL